MAGQGESGGCSATEAKARIVALESGLTAFRELMDERDRRYEQRSASQDTAVSTALATSKEAVSKAEGATERRLETLNELRGVVVDQSRDFARKAEVQLLVENLDKRIDVLSGVVHNREAHGLGIKDTVGYVVGLLGLIIAGLAVFFRH